MNITLALVVLIVVSLLYAIIIYNRLIQAKNRYKNAFSQIDVQLTRRYDLIPNLVETSKAYMRHERETLQAVIAARQGAINDLQKVAKDPGNARAMIELSKSEQGLSGALGRLFAVSESYPDLKADENMRQLSEELTTTENKVTFSRQAFNDAVMEYNILREAFPNNLIAGKFKFLEAHLLQIEDVAKRVAPRVAF
ncbi:MAG: LemA family protein [Methylococcales bacterium]